MRRSEFFKNSMKKDLIFIVCEYFTSIALSLQINIKFAKKYGISWRIDPLNIYRIYVIRFFKK